MEPLMRRAETKGHRTAGPLLAQQVLPEPKSSDPKLLLLMEMYPSLKEAMNDPKRGTRKHVPFKLIQQEAHDFLFGDQ